MGPCIPCAVRIGPNRLRAPVLVPIASGLIVGAGPGARNDGDAVPLKLVFVAPMLVRIRPLRGDLGRDSRATSRLTAPATPTIDLLRAPDRCTAPELCHDAGAFGRSHRPELAEAPQIDADQPDFRWRPLNPVESIPTQVKTPMP